MLWDWNEQCKCTLDSKNRPEWKPKVPRLLHAMNDDKPHQRVEFCKWFQGKVEENVGLVDKVVLSDEASFKFKGLVNHHNCVYWSPDNQDIHVDRAVNLPGFIVWCGGIFLLRQNSYWCCVPQHARGIHYAHHSSAEWKCGILLSRWETPTIPLWSQGLPWWNVSKLIG